MNTRRFFSSILNDCPISVRLRDKDSGPFLGDIQSAVWRLAGICSFDTTVMRFSVKRNKMAYAPVYHAGEFSDLFSPGNECSIDIVFFICFLPKGECKLRLNQQHGIYDNGKALPQVYRERVLDLHHQGLSQRQISQDMRISVGYVNKVVQFYEHSNSSLAARRKTPVRNKFTADVIEYV